MHCLHRVEQKKRLLGPLADVLLKPGLALFKKREIDRFCDALIAIREEIAEIERGEAGEAIDRDQWMDPKLDTEDVDKIRISALLCRERVKALQWVLEIPSALRENAEKAEELLGTIEND